MEVILDACSAINLINSELSEKIGLLQGFVFHIGLIVYDECAADRSGNQLEILDSLISDGIIKQISDDVDLQDFEALKKKFNLGDGETETILNAKYMVATISCDDNKARTKARIELPNGSIIGSLYILRELVRQNIITCAESLIGFSVMRTKGGFLPEVDQDYLCT